MARALALAAANHAPGADTSQVKFCYRRALSRYPSPRELDLANGFLRSQAERRGNRSAALTDFALALFNLNEFIYVD